MNLHHSYFKTASLRMHYRAILTYKRPSANCILKNTVAYLPNKNVLSQKVSAPRCNIDDITIYNYMGDIARRRVVEYCF